MDRRQQRDEGAHYTSEKNILKVINSLYLDNLYSEFKKIQTDRSTQKKSRLKSFHDRISKLTFLDPACGCGNFLIIAYRELRILEIEVIKELFPKENLLLDINIISKVNIDQFYGIELNRFAVRIAKVAFDLAKKRSNKVTSCEKSNVMEAGVLWREEVQVVKDKEYKSVELNHMLADNCAMQLLRNPKQFDVILADNLFGDMLSDEAAMLTGSLGLLPSASLGAKDKNGKIRSLYEPVHGSAPDITGKNIANPIATILSLSMALRYSLNLDKEADQLDLAVQKVLDDGLRTKDIISTGKKEVSTTDMGDAIISKLK